MEKLVLLVDDDKLPMQYYVKALKRKGFKVIQCFDPDSALEVARKKRLQIAVVVLDIMMDPGTAYKHEATSCGLSTGVLLLRDIRQYCPDAPIIVLTNVKNPKILSQFRSKRLIDVAQKMDCPPFELAELVYEEAKEDKQERDSTEG